MKKSQIAINSVSTIRFGLEECLAAYHQAGFKNVEFPLSHIRDYLTQRHTVSDVQRLLGAYRLQCIGGFECQVECFSPARQYRRNHSRILENARLLSELGGTNLVVGTDGPKDLTALKDPLGHIAKTFATIAKEIKGTGVTLCLEFNWSPIVKSLRTACEIARRSRMSNVGVLFDPAHYHCTPTKFDQITSENVAYIKHIHVDDMQDKPGELSDCNADRVLPGKGCLDLKSIFARIEKHGYRGYFSIEMFNEKLLTMPARKAARLMYKSMLRLCRR